LKAQLADRGCGAISSSGFTAMPADWASTRNIDKDETSSRRSLLASTVYAGDAGVGDQRLHAGEPPETAVALRQRAHGRQVGAGFRLGERERRQSSP
jgi:hypothetical protein